MNLSLVSCTILIFVTGFANTMFSQTGASTVQSKGKDIFEHKCVTCHGSDGAGSPVGKSLKVADLRVALVQKKSDVDLSHVIAEGNNSMPPFGNDLSSEDIKAVLSYIRTLKMKKK